MKIEQIADAVSQEMLMHVATLQPELVKWNRKYLSRFLSKLAEQDVGRANWKPLPEDQNERITFDRALHNIYDGDARLAVAITLRTFSNAMSGGTFADTCRVMANEVAKLYTESQLIAAQKRTAEACAKACESINKEYDMDGIYADFFANLIRNGEWRKYL